MSARIRFEQTTVAYRRTVAVDTVTLTAEPGTFTALLGPTGRARPPC